MDAVANQPKKLNQKIAFLCDRDGVSHSELSRIAGVSPPSAAQYREKAIPKAAELNRIASRFGVSIYWLIDDDAAVDEPQTDLDRLDDMAPRSKRFTEKLRKIAEQRGLQKSSLAAISRVSPQAMQRYFEGAAPRPQTALRLAAFLQVDPVWLFNEDEPWTEDYPRGVGQGLDDQELMDEVARRYIDAETGIDKLIDRAELIPWSAIAKEVNAPGEGSEVNRVGAAFDVATALFHLLRSTIDTFDSIQYVQQQYQSKLPRIDLFAMEGENRWGKRRAFYAARIQAIYDQLTALKRSRQRFLAAMEHAVLQLGDARVALDVLREALDRYEAMAGKSKP